MRRAPFVMLVMLGVGVGRTAAAQDAAAAAEISFDKGRQAMSDGKYAAACAAFEQSEKLDPQIGTRYNIGRCLEGQGKLASAWEAYREVAQRDTNEGRRKDAAARAQTIAPRLAKLLVNSAASPVGFVVKVNGRDATNLLGIETPVDPGRYTVVATAPGFADWSATVSATGEGLTVTVSIPALARPEPIAPGTSSHSEPGKATTTIDHLGEPTEPTEPSTGGSNRKTIAIAIGGTGAALAIGGAITAVLARGKWNDAKAVCGGALTCSSDTETAQANALGDAARTRADIATGLIGVGVVAIGVGAALWLTAPTETSDHGVSIIPSAGPDGASVTFAGRF